MKCSLCDSPRYCLYARGIFALGGKDYSLVKCDDCGLVRVEPMLSSVEIFRMYSKEYFESDYSCGIYEGDCFESHELRLNDYHQLLRDISKFKPEGKFLEVGCAAGLFLNEVQKYGYNVTGVDISQWAAEQAKARFGLNVIAEELPQCNFPVNVFDVIFLGDILEHIRDPSGFLQEIHRILKKDGLVVVRLPTYIDSFYFRWLKLLVRLFGMQNKDSNLLRVLKLSSAGKKFAPYHLYEFSLKTLSRLLEKCNFRIINSQKTLLIPEFLQRKEEGSMTKRLILLVFSLLKFLIEKGGITGGHLIVFAVKNAERNQ